MFVEEISGFNEHETQNNLSPLAETNFGENTKERTTLQ